MGAMWERKTEEGSSFMVGGLDEDTAARIRGEGPTDEALEWVARTSWTALDQASPLSAIISSSAIARTSNSGTPKAEIFKGRGGSSRSSR